MATINVTSITVITTADGSDYVYIHTDLPEPGWSYTGAIIQPDGPVLKFICAAETGYNYCKKHFPDIEPTTFEG